MKKNGMVMVLTALVTVLELWGAETVDPRERTYVDPVRIVWTSGTNLTGFCARSCVSGAENLLAPKLGQVPEREYCMMTNRGYSAGIVLDFGRELHGGVQIAVLGGSARPRVRLRFGESVAETFSNVVEGEKGASNDHALRDFEMMLPVYGTIEVGNTGFRFLRLDLLTTGELAIDSIRAVSLMRPMKPLGSFRCSDARLNLVFDTAVRTVHLCCQDKLWDGIKRDRLVWMGDTYPETKTLLTVFGAASVLPESLDYMVAKTPPDAWMNGISTYTFWFIRNLMAWYRFTGDVAYVRRHGAYLRDTVRNMSTYLTEKGTMEGMRRPFVDWPTEHNRPAVFVGTQALAVLAYREAAELAAAIGDETLKDLAVACERKMTENLTGTLSPHGSKQAAALLALSGLADASKMFAEVLGRNGHAGVSTFYGYFMLEAMSAVGENQRALETIRDYWGAMNDVGATSYWEDFNLAWTNGCFRIDELPPFVAVAEGKSVSGAKDIHGDYGEFCYPGFRHSLCHGWSGGPAAWLIEHVLGIRPTSPGCRTYEVRPFLGDLAWAEGSLALPDGGSVFVRVEKGSDGRAKVVRNARRPPKCENQQNSSPEQSDHS